MKQSTFQYYTSTNHTQAARRSYTDLLIDAELSNIPTNHVSPDTDEKLSPNELLLMRSIIIGNSQIDTFLGFEKRVRQCYDVNLFHFRIFTVFRINEEEYWHINLQPETFAYCLRHLSNENIDDPGHHTLNLGYKQ
jgi:hypothetical protein